METEEAAAAKPQKAQLLSILGARHSSWQAQLHGLCPDLETPSQHPAGAQALQAMGTEVGTHRGQPWERGGTVRHSNLLGQSCLCRTWHEQSQLTCCSR